MESFQQEQRGVLCDGGEGVVVTAVMVVYVKEDEEESVWYNGRFSHEAGLGVYALFLDL